MSKRSSHIVKTGQLEGAELKIAAVYNDGLQESVTLVNQGTVVQPLSGWVLASLRGQSFFLFPDDLIIYPGLTAVVHSGQQESRKASRLQDAWVDLLWTTDQVWNNRGDIAILFDTNGLEIDRYSYPHERIMGSSANRRKILLRIGDGYEIVDDTHHRAKKVTRKQNGIFVGQY